MTWALVAVWLGGCLVASGAIVLASRAVQRMLDIEEMKAAMSRESVEHQRALLTGELSALGELVGKIEKKADMALREARDTKGVIGQRRRR